MSPISDLLNVEKIQTFANDIKDRSEDALKSMVPQAYLDDPVGGKTSWSHLPAPGQRYSGFRIDDEEAVILKQSLFLILAVFITLFFSLPLLFIAFIIQSIPFFLFILISAGLSLKLFFVIENKIQKSTSFQNRNIIDFDSSSQLITLPSQGSGATQLPYGDIYAIQIVSKFKQRTTSTSGSGRRIKRSHTHTTVSHQLLLVKNDAQRVVICETTDHDKIRSGAQKLNTHLEVPLWDASFGEEEIGKRKKVMLKALFNTK